MERSGPSQNLFPRLGSSGDSLKKLTILIIFAFTNKGSLPILAESIFSFLTFSNAISFSMSTFTPTTEPFRIILFRESFSEDVRVFAVPSSSESSLPSRTVSTILIYKTFVTYG